MPRAANYDRERNTQYQRERRARKRAEKLAQQARDVPPGLRDVERVTVVRERREVPAQWTPQTAEPMPLMTSAERVARFRAKLRESVQESAAD